MNTLSQYFKTDSAYWGERGNWLVACTLNRDSDALSRSNFRCFIQALGGTGAEGKKGCQDISDTVAIEEASHWACGWVQYLVIDPADVAKVKLAEKLLEKLGNYPVLNEEDFSNEETEEANEIWRHCYNAAERLKYIRRHRNQFDFNGLADLLGCVRGNYFAGYASELIH